MLVHKVNAPASCSKTSDAGCRLRSVALTAPDIQATRTVGTGIWPSGSRRTDCSPCLWAREEQGQHPVSESRTTRSGLHPSRS